MRKSIVILFILILSAAPSFADYIESRNLTLPAQNINELEINAGAGTLEIAGYDNLDKIEVMAEIELEGISKKDGAEFIQRYAKLDLNAHGSTARLESTFEDNSVNFFNLFSHNRSGQINLYIKIPKNIALDIEDGSGDMIVENTDAGVIISDGSGGIAIRNIGGRLKISDGSGDIRVRQIRGDVDIDDGSGSVEIRDVVGDVDLNDGSGDLVVEEIDGSVTVDDGSGDINIDGVKQDVFIGSSGSGGESITNVDGDIDGDLDYSYYHYRRHRR
jgi:hypothetical protein